MEARGGGKGEEAQETRGQCPTARARACVWFTRRA